MTPLHREVVEFQTRATGTFGRPPIGFLKISIRDQGRNRDAIVASLGILSFFEEVSCVILKPVLEGLFDIEKEYGFRTRVVPSLNQAEDVERTVNAVLQHTTGQAIGIAEVRVNHGELLNDLQVIKDNSLLGRNTAGKMAFVTETANAPFRTLTPRRLEGVLLDLQRATVELLSRQQQRLLLNIKQDGKTTSLLHSISAVSEMADKIQTDCLTLSLERHYSTYRPVLDSNKQYFEVYADRISQILHDHLPARDESMTLVQDLEVVTDAGISTRLSRRDCSFLTLGDCYGDCTARAVREQVDPEVANIHWTVYPWLLDPFYWVVEVLMDGKECLKGHLTPLIIRNQRVLMVDAIEAIPQLRKLIRGKLNTHVSESLFRQRHRLLNTLLQRCSNIASEMNADAAFVDRYSNAIWVREELDRLPSDGYHVSEVVKPFGNRVVEHNVREILGKPCSELSVEIQAINLRLMDQCLRPGYKEVAVLFGRRSDWSIPVRGI